MPWFGRGNYRGDRSRRTDAALVEALEDRLALYQGPMIAGLPPIASLENQFDTVVRIDTNLGKIDIELFDYQAQTTVDNFKRYVNTGRFDEMFFDKKVGTVLQAGLYKFNDGSGLRTITTDAAIPNGFSRSNLARTLTMVPETGTTTRSRFIINLQDNTAFNTLNGGYTVFAKVVQGWDVVLAIAALTSRDLDQPLTGSNPNPGTFDNVPTTATYNPSVGPTEATLVRITDIEVVKSRGTNRYYEQTLVFPEGFRSPTTIERVDMVNLDAGRQNFYQVIVRYENGERDSIVFSGVMQPGARLSLKINDFNLPNYNAVRAGVGYAIEIRSTRAFSASLDHRDSGFTLGESFQLLARLYPGQLRMWNIGGGDKGPNYTSYVLFLNLTDQNTTVNLLFTGPGGATFFTAIPLKAARRGGIAVHTLTGLPDGAYSVQAWASQPIVVSLSEYKIGGAGNASDGSAQIASLGTGRPEGYLAGAQIPIGGEAHFDLYYSDLNTAAVFVDFEFILTDGTVLNGNPVLLTASLRRARVDLLSLNPSLPTGQFFSVHYTARNGTTPIAISYAAEAAGDQMSTTFQTTTAGTVAFGDGFTDPTLNASQFSETISVFNPFTSNVSFIYDLKFHFTDGTVIFAAAQTPPGFFSLASRHRADHHATDFPAVMAKINSGPGFRFYSVEVISSAFLPGFTNSVMAQMTRIHNTWGQSLTSIPALDPTLPLLFADDPQFH